jgi:hypothetical protein
MHDHHSNSAFLDDIPADAPVLVCVVTRVADFDRIRAGWYRVPLDRARVPLTASARSRAGVPLRTAPR